jgi:phage gp36-like protein
MPYAQVSDMVARYPNRDLVQLTNENPQATTVNTEFVTIVLSDASAEIDSYISTRFELPMSDPPAVLLPWCCRIAMYLLQQLRPIHDLQDARDRYRDIIKQLEQVRDGKLSLGLATDSGEEPAPAEETVLTESPRVEGGAKMLTPGRLKGF